MTVVRGRLSTPRIVAAIASIVLIAAAVATQVAAAPPAPVPTALAAQLRAGSWAMNVPNAWLAAPPPRLVRGDLLDVLAVKQGERAYVVPVAFAITVLSVDERGLMLEVTEDDANAIAVARGGGLLLVPLLRSAR